MNFLNRAFLTLVFAGLFAAAATVAQADPVVKAVRDYTVFLDPPTGFAFVKLPAGVLTALLTGDDDNDNNETSALASRRGK